MQFIYNPTLNRIKYLLITSFVKCWFYLIIAICLGTSCEEIVTPPEIENIEDKLVVNSIISPLDSAYIVEVTLSRPSFGPLPDYGNDYVNDATVTISDGKSTGVFIYNEDFRNYQLQADMFAIQPETTYLLTVVANGMEVTATCSTENAVETLESYSIGNDFSLTVEWTDVKDQLDYYGVVAYFIRDEAEYTNFYYYYFEDDIISDKGRDGKILQDMGEAYDEPRDGDRLRIILSRYDELYADYFQILENYYGDDPFSQPVQLPSNVDGGLGIFSIVQQLEFEIEI